MLKKSFVLILGICFIAVITFPVQAQGPPSFYAGERLQFSNSSDLKPPQYAPYPQYPQYNVDNNSATPCVCDWNGNGNKDLLSGYFYEGWIYFYNNIGSNADPEFTQGDEELMEAGGSTISVGYG